jgi:uncharacterized protein
MSTQADERRLLGLLAWSAAALIAAEFLLIPLRVRRLVPSWDGTLRPFVWWAAGLLVLWVVVPTVIMRGKRSLPFSIALPRTRAGLALYGGLVAVMLPALLIASRDPAFLSTYPMLRPAPPLTWSAGTLVVYWLCYGTILFSTEYLFRGVLLFALEPRLGVASVGVSVLPYCLIHVHKPLPEAFGSIIAGFVLGYLALRTRSIGGGVLVHCVVAFTMDALALSRLGVFG